MFCPHRVRENHPYWSERPRFVKFSPGRHNLGRHLLGEPKLCSAGQGWAGTGRQMGGSRAAKPFALCPKFFVLSG